MSSLVPTIIRLPKEDLEKYKAVAEEDGVSFSRLVRESLHRTVVTPSVAIRVKKEKFLFDPEPYRKWSSGAKHGARDHDKYIYKQDW